MTDKLSDALKATDEAFSGGKIKVDTDGLPPQTSALTKRLTVERARLEATIADCEHAIRKINAALEAE